MARELEHFEASEASLRATRVLAKLLDVRISSRRPRDPRLRALVRMLWYCEDAAACGEQRMLPSGTMQLIVNLRADELSFAEGTGRGFIRRSGALIQGMQSRSVILDRKDQRQVLGIVFEPGTARVLLGVPLEAVADDHVPVQELPADRVGVREHLLEANTIEARFERAERWLVARICGEIDPVIRVALDLMQRGEHRMADLASKLGLSDRSFRRRFRAEVGLAPKTMSRVLRFQRALEGLRGADPLCDVALACGYWDQSHLNHEFEELALLSPAEYRRQSPVYRNHLE